jgi:hypothetical protein
MKVGVLDLYSLRSDRTLEAHPCRVKKATLKGGFFLEKGSETPELPGAQTIHIVNSLRIDRRKGKRHRRQK